MTTRTATLAALTLPLLLSTCTQSPGMVLHAPARIERALSVASDLNATAALVPKGKSAEAAQALARGDDGVTFSGFLAASPGTYTLEVTFTGVVASLNARHFLGRITSESFTVTQGAVATPVFSAPVDTIGRVGDHGDDDQDGLGLLDELLLGTDPQKADSDGDGVVDGKDCKPTDAGDSFVILAGGTFDDCDGDGFNGITALLGAAGTDCNDEDATINPGVHDDCSNTIDEDCNPQTCPVDDSTGPTVELISPTDGSTIGCNAPFVVHATDASDVQGVLMTAVGHPLAGGSARTLVMIDGGDHLTWNAPDGYGIEGTGLVNGEFPVDITARDNRGNPTTIHADFTLTIGFPSVTMTGPDSIVDGSTAHLTVTPTGPRTLVTLELRASAFDPSSSKLDLTTETVVATLPVGGGSADVDPASLPANAVVYPVAVDDIGNTASPLDLGAFLTPLGVTTGYLCDASPDYLPGVAKRSGITGPVSMQAHLADAIAAAKAVDSTAFLVKIVGFGMAHDGTIDLSTTSTEFEWIYGFMTPAQAAFPDSARGISVTWHSAGFPGTNPAVDPSAGGVFEINPMDQNPAHLIDSTAVATAYPCGGLGWTGHDSNDSIIYLRGDGDAFDNINLSTADGYSWGVHASDLSTPTFGCSCPTNVVNCPP